jgi:hypothetical protein
MLAPRASLGGAAVIPMPYQGMTLSIEEMLDVLTSRGRTEAAAALELERAFEEKAILLLFADGTNADGEILYSKLSSENISAVIMVLKDLSNRTRVTPIGAWNIPPIALFKAARAMRHQFEAKCRLSESEDESVSVPNRRFVSDEKLVVEALEGIRSGRWANPHKAAQELARDAEGASYQSSVLRFGKQDQGSHELIYRPSYKHL